jgi:LPS export ABC transporter protein LptC
MDYKAQARLTAIYSSFFSLVIVALLFTGCGDDSGEQVAQPPEDVEQELSQFSLMQSREGRTKWTLTADSATFLETNWIALEGVKLLLFGDKDDETMTIHGDKGKVNEGTYDLTITGNVEGVSSDGGRLNAEEIHWRDRTGKIYTSPGVKVTITYKDSVMFGEQLLADPRLETVRMRKFTGVTTRVEEEGSEKSAD